MSSAPDVTSGTKAMGWTTLDIAKWLSTLMTLAISFAASASAQDQVSRPAAPAGSTEASPVKVIESIYDKELGFRQQAAAETRGIAPLGRVSSKPL
jgi:hypothetical protein